MSVCPTEKFQSGNTKFCFGFDGSGWGFFWVFLEFLVGQTKKSLLREEISVGTEEDLTIRLPEAETCTGLTGSSDALHLLP